jgi:hypothetical protein
MHVLLLVTDGGLRPDFGTNCSCGAGGICHQFRNSVDHDGGLFIPKEPILLLTMLVIVGLEILIVVVEYLPQGRIGGLSGLVDRRMGMHR